MGNTLDRCDLDILEETFFDIFGERVNSSGSRVLKRSTKKRQIAQRSFQPAEVIEFPLLDEDTCQIFIRKIEQLNGISGTKGMLGQHNEFSATFEELSNTVFVPIIEKFLPSLNPVTFQNYLILSSMSNCHDLIQQQSSQNGSGIILNICLSDNFKGGELVFLENGNDKVNLITNVIKRKRGYCTLYEKNQKYTYGPVLSGVQYSLVLVYKFAPYFPLFCSLDDDVKSIVFQQLDFETLLNVSLVSKYYSDYLSKKNETFWNFYYNNCLLQLYKSNECYVDEAKRKYKRKCFQLVYAEERRKEEFNSIKNALRMVQSLRQEYMYNTCLNDYYEMSVADYGSY